MNYDENNRWRVTLKSDRFLISPYNINPELHIKVLRRKEMIIDKKFVIVTQILLVSTFGNL